MTRYRSNLEIFISLPDEKKQNVSEKKSGPPDPPAGRPTAAEDPAGSRTGTLDGAAAVLVAWSSPPYDGGRCVDSYRVEARAESETDWRVVAERCHSLSVVVRELSPGRRYVFRVRAENVHGLSEPSATSLPHCTPTLVDSSDQPPPPAPFAPRHVTVEPLDEFRANYEVLEELGKGRYGVVHRVTERASVQTRAAKFIRTIKAKDRQQVHDEIAIMNLLRHPKLLQLAAAFESPREVVMVMEYISGGELFERVVADDFTLTERDCILFMRQICEGVDYMHENQIVHLDLKPENIMCQTRTSHQIKLIDFGLAQKLKPDTPVRVLFGTPEFIPPEIINYEPIGTESDMWSVGVICYVLLSGLSPFMGDNDAETFANITRADFDFDDEAFDAISQDARDFISALLVKRKEKRLTARQCLEHQWMAQQPTSMSCIALSTDKLKKFIIRRKWQKTGNAIRALGRMATLSAASRRNSASSASGSPRPSLSGTPMARMFSLNEADGLEVGLDAVDISEELSPDCVDLVVAPAVGVKGDDVDVCLVPDDAQTTDLLSRGRLRSERSDSGISDCSSASSRNRDHAQCPAPLLAKKFSISEEAEHPPTSDSRVDPPALVPAASKDVTTHPVLPALTSPPVNGSCQPLTPPAHDVKSTVSRRSEQILERLGVNVASDSPAALGDPAVAAHNHKAGGPSRPAAAAPGHKAAGLRARPGREAQEGPGRTASRKELNGLSPRSSIKTSPGFVESKIKTLESKASSQSPQRVSIRVVPPREHTDLSRKQSASPVRRPPTNHVSLKDRAAHSPTRKPVSPLRQAASPARSPAREKLATSPNRRELSPAAPGSRPANMTLALSPSRRDRSPGKTTSSPIRRQASPARQTLASPAATNQSPRLGATTRERLSQLQTSREPVSGQTNSPPKSPTLRRMMKIEGGPNKLATHSAGFQKTLEFWKR